MTLYKYDSLNLFSRHWINSKNFQFIFSFEFWKVEELLKKKIFCINIFCICLKVRSEWELSGRRGWIFSPPPLLQLPKYIFWYISNPFDNYVFIHPWDCAFHYVHLLWTQCFEFRISTGYPYFLFMSNLVLLIIHLKVTI